MNPTIRTVFALLVVACSCSVAIAQTAETPALKIAYVDVDYVYAQMPEAKQIDSELKAMETQLMNTINTKTQELQAKYKKYMEDKPNLLPAIAASTENEIQQQMANLEQLKQNAQASLDQKNQKLLEPVYKKMSDAIDAMAKQNGYNLVLNGRIGGQDVVLYADEKADASDAVLKQLGITPASTAAATPKDPSKK